LREYLEIKGNNADFLFQPALTSSEGTLPTGFYSFTIDKGSKDGIAPNDPRQSQPTKGCGHCEQVGLTHFQSDHHPGCDGAGRLHGHQNTGDRRYRRSVELAREAALRFSYHSARFGRQSGRHHYDGPGVGGMYQGI
jgi:hypothetical protein